MLSKARQESLFENLARSRELLATSPLTASLELALTPLSEAAEMLGARDMPLSSGEQDRLVRELAGVRQLLEGLGQWLSSRGALTPTYNCHAELDSLSGASSTPAGGAAWGAPGRGNLLVEG